MFVGNNISDLPSLLKKISLVSFSFVHKVRFHRKTIIQECLGMPVIQMPACTVNKNGKEIKKLDLHS